jgi:outer membrane receptor protein involved in Fe transport
VQIKIRLNIALLSFIVAIPPVLSHAQTVSAEVVEVTGSRIRSPSAESISPLTVLTAADIAASGVINLQDLLLQMPEMGTPTISRTNSNFSTSSAGVATIDLRNLGTSRTLVLINGRRVVSGIPGINAVDFNTIPTEFVERIEVLTGGASALYGSDAVAGVINIVLKSRMDGFLVDVQTGLSTKGDDKTTKASMTWGGRSEDGRSYLMSHFSLSDQGGVYSRDRASSSIDQASLGAYITYDSADFFTAQRPFYSSFAPQGRFFTNPGVTSNSKTFDANGNLIGFSSNGPNGDGVGATGFNRSAYRTIALPTKRALFSSKGEHATDDANSIFFESTWASTRTSTTLEPFGADIGAEAFPATGYIPADFRQSDGTVVRNPLIPLSLYNLLRDVDGDGLREYAATRRLNEFGGRYQKADRDTFRFSSGLRGELSNDWNYDSYVSYGSTKESQVGGGQYNTLNMRNALMAIPDVNDVNGNGNTSEAICMDANARRQGCVPVNIFGYNTITPEALKYIRAPSQLSTMTSLTLAGAVVTGSPINLPAGKLGLALGVEYRREASRSEFDALTQAGLNAGNAIPSTRGAFNVKEIFGELRIPVLKDLPMIKSLSSLIALRSGDYSTVGNTLSWNAGLEWAINNDFKVRGTKSLATRAPNISELYAPSSQTFPADLSDPCQGVTATSVGIKDVRCRAATGVSSNIATNSGVFTQTQSDIQGVSGYDKGNPDLKQEKGRTSTLGFVLTPRSIPALEKFVFSIDYYKIDIDQAIVSTPRAYILNECYSGNAAFCQLIKRRANPVGANSAGSLEFVDSSVTNSGGVKTDGVDMAVAFNDHIGPGKFSSRLAYSRLLSGSVVPAAGYDPDVYAGEVGASKNRLTLNLGYDYDKWGIRTTTIYIGKSALDDQFLMSFDVAPGSVTVPSKTYVNIQLTYAWSLKSKVFLGVDNAMDTKAPPIMTGLPGSTTGAETAASVYDPIGRRFYLGFRGSF